MLDVAEPSGLLKDSMIFKAAGVKLYVRPEDRKNESEAQFDPVSVCYTEWPFANHRSMHLPDEEIKSSVQTPASQKTAMINSIKLSDVQKYGGSWLNVK